jgi:chaperone required for assembly of F1-ATPase
MKRFYKEACAADRVVMLDGRPLNTPGRNPFAPPTQALAEACALEWAVQGDVIRPETMPLTRLCNVAIDRTPLARPELVAAIAKHGQTDLLCHRAEAPAALVAAQAGAWDPWLQWAAEALSFTPEIVAGVRAARNDVTPLALAAHAMDDFLLTGLAHGVGLAGSAILSFALARGAMTGAEVFEAAMLDELYQLKAWGEDEAARARLAHIAAEFETLERFVAALKDHRSRP